MLALRLTLASLGLLAHSAFVSGASSPFDFDLAIIGGGSGGYAAARTAAAEGLKTVVIEGAEEVGGLCILRGCMPTKALLYAAEVMHLTSHARAWGIHAPEVSFNFGEVMGRKNALIQEFADFRRQELASGKFTFLRARARFADAHTLELTRPAGLRIQADDDERPSAAFGHGPRGYRDETASSPQPSPPEEERERAAGPSELGGTRRAEISGGSRPATKERGEGSPSSIVPLGAGRRVEGEGLRKLTAKHFIIATGSTIAPSPLAQLNDLDCLNSDSALKLERLPKSLIVLGGGAVAVEFAQFFARFGVRVTMIQRSSHIMHEFDFDASSELESVFRREGITLYTGTRLLDARIVSAQKEITFLHNDQRVRVQAEEAFFALGRIPSLAGLGLEKIGVQADSNRIITDAQMRTSVPHVYAAGDCTGPHEIVHLAVQQGEIAAHNAAHPDRMKQMDYRLLTEVIFTEPQIATVGLTEKRARADNIPYLAASYRFRDHGKSLIMEARDGFVKLLADPLTAEIIGGCCVGPLGGELIHEIIVAMHSRMTVHQLAALPHYHPTLAEIWTYPAEELAAKIPKGDSPCQVRRSR